ncbi:hypothetical protein ATI53_103916 [Salipiger aestuarii]|uniref:Uncharacterized protein n=1 Tax=Salipiger aestuarii TaxID=568098 RepID=A0A327XYL1_9RHOB|nr:hypothetical protein ATI53_103916 [Salipiger aestuarii]
MFVIGDVGQTAQIARRLDDQRRAVKLAAQPGDKLFDGIQAGRLVKRIKRVGDVFLGKHRAQIVDHDFQQLHRAGAHVDGSVAVPGQLGRAIEPQAASGEQVAGRPRAVQLLNIILGKYGAFDETDVRWLATAGADFDAVVGRADSEYVPSGM